MFTQAGPAAVQVLNQLLPAIVDMASGLVPVVVLVTKAAASVLNWLAANHLLIPALIAVGAAVAIASGGLTLIIPAIALAAGGIVHLWQTSQRFRDIVTTVFSNVGQQLATFAGLWLDEWHFMSDSLLTAVHQVLVGVQGIARVMDLVMGTHLAAAVTTALRKDRKSTRLNSSHQIISYAVFCLKKKKEQPQLPHPTATLDAHPLRLCDTLAHAP